MLLTMMATTGRMWGQSSNNITWSASEQGYSNAQEISSVTFDTNVSGTFAKGTSNNTPKYYNTGAAIRCYGGNTITVTTASGNLTSISLTFATGEGTNAITTDVGTYANGTWTGSAESVKFTIGGTNGHRRIASFSIEYSSGGGSAPSITANNVSIDYDATEGSIAYTINNGVEGGELTASVPTNSWITLGDVADDAVPFTCAANTENNARTETVTLTYTYNTNETVTKDVTVTQAAAPVVFTTIPGLFEAATATETDVLVTFNSWVVSGVSTNGKNIFVTDNNGNGFVIYSSDNMSGTYAAGNILSGTVSCKLKLYNGFAELLNVDADDLTITEGGTVTVAEVAMADLTGVNTGALLHYDNLTCNINNNRYYLSDGTTELQVYNALYAFDALEDGKIYNITGVYQQYTTTNNNTKEILPRSADDIEEVVSTEPTITVANATVNIGAEGGDGTLTVTYENFTDIAADVYFCDAQGEAAQYDWIVAEINTDNNVDYIIGANDGAARTAYLKVYALDDQANYVYSNLITINQDEYVAPTYAALPFTFNGVRADIEGTDGLYQEGLGSDYSPSTSPNTKLKFDTTNDWLLLQFEERPGTLTFSIKNNSFSEGTFKVQTSVDGTTFEDLKIYTDEVLINTLDEEFTELNENIRYIKWIYTDRQSGNVGLGNIALAKYVAPVASITVTPDLIEAPATPVAPATAITGSLTVTLSNITITELDQLGVDFCDENGTLLTGANTKPSWFESTFELVGEEYKLNYTIAANTETTERVAYFKVYEVDSEVYSNKVTVTQEAYVAPTAIITVNPDLVEATAAEAEGNLGITLENITISQVDGHFEVYFCDENGTIITEGKPNWLTGEVQLENNVFSLYYMIDENTASEARTAYMKVYGLSDDGNTEAYSNKITFTQAGATGPVTTGTIVFGNNGTKINATSVTGDDSMGNIWTVTTVGTTSFTQNNAYSQVGKSTEPATSITFTTTLAQATTITNFEAKFGGFSGTAGNINLLIGETNVGSGSLDATNDVTVTNTTTETGTTLTVTVTNIAKGVKCYYISYTISTSTDPMISAPASIDLASDATAGEIEYSIINPATGVNLEATTTTSWISNIAVDDDKVTFTTTANTETTERQGTITLSYTGAESKDVTIIQAAYVPPVVMDSYALFTGDLVEGDYIVYYNGYAMKNTVTSGRLDNVAVNPENYVIATDDATIIWHIAQSGEYWTIYSADANAYAASTGVKNKAQMLEDGTDDKALWTVTGTETFEFVNKANAAANVNANLRNNGANGWACYATQTGGALSLYKKAYDIPAVSGGELTADATIPAGEISVYDNLTIPSGADNVLTVTGTLIVTGTFTNETASHLIIEDGGQLVFDGTGVQATMKKSTAHANTGSKDAADWYTIASPLAANVAPSAVGNLTSSAYDLYRYNEGAATWENQNNPAHAADFTELEVGRGYLYWNTNGDELEFAGELRNADVNYTLKADADGDAKGFNLIGNPFSQNITMSNITGATLPGGYVLTKAGAWKTSVETTIAPCQGFLVQVDEEKAIIISKSTGSKSRANRDFIAFTVANGQYEDVTYAMFEEGLGLNKINHRNSDIPMVYIPQNGQNYAIATMSDETQSFNLNFKAMTTGKYTLSYKAEGKYDYLHVIDRITGEDVDMLLDGEYSFMASAGDNDARFIVKLRYDANGNFDSDIFAYQNGNDVIVNGEGELQMFDLTGRMVANTMVNGVQTVNVPAQGVYIFRLVGNDVKTQKIVVR